MYASLHFGLPGQGGPVPRPARRMAGFAVLATLALFALPTAAATLNVRPITLLSDPTTNVSVTGTVTTGTTSGSLSAWSIAVTTVQTLAHFTPANTPIKSVSGLVSSSGLLGVQTATDPSAGDGGSLSFLSRNPFASVGVSLADFTDPTSPGGQAMYMNGPAFDYLSLNQPTSSLYQVAQSMGGNVFALAPMTFSGGVSLTGTITTDDTTGALAASNILSWDISVVQTVIDLFDQSNSSLQASGLGVAPNGTDVTVTNPAGFLGFVKGVAGGHPYSVVLADFSDPLLYGGQAGYFQGRLQTLTIPLGASRGPWTVTGTVPVAAAVPVPAAFPLLALALVGFGLVRWPRRKAGA